MSARNHGGQRRKECKYDVHVHTSETSPCSRISAVELVRAYKKAGYTGLVITDHFFEDMFYDCKGDWDTCVDRFLAGYNAAKEAGDACGLDVLLGAELRFGYRWTDYLVYGMDEAFLRAHPNLYRMTPEAFYEAFGEQLLIIGAHPFRTGTEMVHMDAVHGVELVNAHARQDNHNERTLALCKRKPSLYRFCGSDTHRLQDVGRAALVFGEELHSIQSFCAKVEAGAYQLWCPAYDDIIGAAQALSREA